MKVDLLHTMASDLIVANVARVSFNKESHWITEDRVQGFTPAEIRDPQFLKWSAYAAAQRDADKPCLNWADFKLIHFLAQHNHWSPFAHTSLQFRIKAPIFVARQLGKHQVGLVWNEVSRRYVDAPPEFYEPETWRKRAENKKQGSLDEPVPYLCTDENGDQCRPLPFKLEGDGRTSQAYSTFLRITMGLYDEMIASGVCPEQARMVLPQSMYTEWIWTGSLYAFARVVSLRDKPDAQKETQVIARMIAEKCAEAFPVSWEALTTKK